MSRPLNWIITKNKYLQISISSFHEERRFEPIKLIYPLNHTQLLIEVSTPNRESGRSWIYYICLLRVSILSLVTIFDRILKSFRQRGIFGFSFYFTQQIDKYLVTFRGLYDVLYLLWLEYSIPTPSSKMFAVSPQSTIRYWS